MSKSKHTEDSKKNISSIDHFKKEKANEKTQQKKEDVKEVEETHEEQSVAEVVNKNLRNQLNSK